MNEEKENQKWDPITWVVIIIGIIGVLLAIAIPSFVKARNTAAQQACINNLRIINAGREQAVKAYSTETEKKLKEDANKGMEHTR